MILTHASQRLIEAVVFSIRQVKIHEDRSIGRNLFEIGAARVGSIHEGRPSGPQGPFHRS